MPGQRESRAHSQSRRSARASASERAPSRAPQAAAAAATSGWPQEASELHRDPRSQQDHRVPVVAPLVSSSAGPAEEQPAKRYNLSHHHHHYYHCTTTNGSELAASWLPTAAPSQAKLDNALNSSFTNAFACCNHNYDQNILLFATEHNNQQAAKASNHVVGNKLGAQSRRAMVAGQPHSPAPNQPQQRSQLHHHYRSPLSAATGRFISQYPSWRHSHSPTAAHYQNYSFHVPLHQQQQQQQHHYGYASGSASRRGDTLPERRPRAHSSNREAAARLSQTSRSRTHLQQLSSSATCDDNYNRAYEEFGGSLDTPQSPGEAPMGTAAVAAAAAGLELGGYQQQQQQPQMVLSERNLAAHITRTQTVLANTNNRLLLLDHGGADNPFKPGTELSWEADLMVRLMRRGYPVQQLPALVESAKHVAAGPWGHSSDDLTTGGLLALDREAWAGGLSRAKSLVRCNGNSTSRDSIDRLIARIEQLVVVGSEKPLGELSTDATSAARQQSAAAAPQSNKRPETTKQSSSSSSFAIAKAAANTEVKPTTTTSTLTSTTSTATPTTTTTTTTGKPTDKPNKKRQRKSHQHRVKTKDVDCCVLS